MHMFSRLQTSWLLSSVFPRALNAPSCKHVCHKGLYLSQNYCRAIVLSSLLTQSVVNNRDSPYGWINCHDIAVMSCHDRNLSSVRVQCAVCLSDGIIFCCCYVMGSQPIATVPIVPLQVLAGFFAHVGTFENLLLGPGESYRPLMPKKLLAVYRKGACFGEPDLLHAQPHSSTVVCSGVGMLALVPRKQYLVPLLPHCSLLLRAQIFRL